MFSFEGLRFFSGRSGPHVRAGVAADTMEQRKRRSSQLLRRRSCSPRWRRKVACVRKARERRKGC